jgi:two-component system cell cycle response regulator DivK
VTAPLVLVVDDNPLNIELVSDLLVASGFGVRSSESAEAGIEMARDLMPALVLMDINLPGMDGRTATRLLKSDPATSSLKIVGLTAHTNSEVSDANKVFDGYITKPINIRTFTATIKALIAE